ncbi:S8 family serine peptidase [Spirulina sp. 06S082]|uniref:S8 family serine peptidase n=1 Tax=Spirulina sp. 06S082 TaxID=3110248 RepID=UPI002B212F5C|nr:S8 family serine peptidase [Spirulina sp. 06S082]MEA5472028.1 S8 family serine peptidase [Spirulina sp. 06S082]
MSGQTQILYPTDNLNINPHSVVPPSELGDRINGNMSKSFASLDAAISPNDITNNIALVPRDRLPSPPNNQTPQQLRFTLDKSSYTLTESIAIREGWVWDGDGAIDLDRIELEIQQNGNSLVNLGQITDITVASWDTKWGSFHHLLPDLELTGGDYALSAIAYDRLGAASTSFQRNFKVIDPNFNPNSTPDSPRFSLDRITYESGDILQIQNGWAFDKDGAIDLQKITFTLENSTGNAVLFSEQTNLTPASWSSNWGSFIHKIHLAGLNVGNYTLHAVSYDQSNAKSDIFSRSLTIDDPILSNNSPEKLQFTLDKTTYSSNETLNLKNAWVSDLDGATDIDRIDVSLWLNGNELFSPQQITNLTPAAWSPNWANFDYNLNLSNFGSGTYTLKAIAYDKIGAASNSFARQFKLITPISNFSNFAIFDASGDTTANTVFQDGALRLNYTLENIFDLERVRLEAWQNGSLFSTLGTWSNSDLKDALINLDGLNLVGGTYNFRAVANTFSGLEINSFFQGLNIFSWDENTTQFGTVAGEFLSYNDIAGIGHIFVGRGGTDTLSLGLDRDRIASINGINLANYDPFNSTSKQAIFQGTAFDFISLTNGNEIYFQGIERLEFTTGDILDLQVKANDTYFNKQWNLRVSDVENAWRFSRGSQDVLLVTLDTGILSEFGSSDGVYDLDLDNRLITDSTDVDGYKNYGHGHSATTIMAATSNNNFGVTGINWYSDVYVTNVYIDGVDLQTAIKEAIAYAKASDRRVVFQTGVQGEFWLTQGGTQAQLEELIRDNADRAIFAVAAGNGGQDIDIPDDTRFSGGVARLQTNHENVMAIGALGKTGTTTIDGLTNATSVDRASYSNYGSSLTLMAATDSPAMNKLGSFSTFGGTSAANPNMAGIASLVWSVNTALSGGELRQILIDTAMDLTTTRLGIAAGEGKDAAFGHGLVNADAAIRRAVALSRNKELANLYNGRSQFA